MPSRDKLEASALLLLAMAGVGVLALAPQPAQGVLADAVLDAGHVPLFAVVSYLVWRCLGVLVPLGRWGSLALTFIAVALAGASTEYLQSFGPRDADPMDFVRDLLGATATLSLVAAFARPAQTKPRAGARAGLVALSIAALAVGLSPLLVVIDAYRMRAENFPVLLAFESEHELAFVSCRDATMSLVERSEAWPASGSGKEGAARVTFLPGQNPAVILRHVSPDWSAYDRLEFGVWWTGSSPLAISLRIDDEQHRGSFGDRFDRSIDLEPGPNAIVIELDDVRRAPRNRELDLRRVRSFTLFLPPTSEERVLYLDAVRLTGSSSPLAPGPAD